MLEAGCPFMAHEEQIFFIQAGSTNLGKSKIAFSSGHAAVPTFACFPYTTHAVMLAGNHPPGHQDPDFILV
jgi:hypothetical protein